MGTARSAGAGVADAAAAAVDVASVTTENRAPALLARANLRMQAARTARKAPMTVLVKLTMCLRPPALDRNRPSMCQHLSN
jgi:hypothetical protein